LITRKPMIFVVLTVIALLALACNFSVSTARITSAEMARDQDGADPTTVFAEDDTFYAIVDLANAPDDTVVKASWTAVAVEGVEPNLLIDETEIETGDGTLYFELSNSDLWPAGKYKVDIYLNDKLAETLEFEVQ